MQNIDQRPAHKIVLVDNFYRQNKKRSCTHDVDQCYQEAGEKTETKQAKLFAFAHYLIWINGIDCVVGCKSLRLQRVTDQTESTYLLAAKHGFILLMP